MAKILVVDDERSIRELAAIVLKKEGHELELCESGDVACIRLAQDAFDLVLTDLKMPGKSGMDVLLAAKQADRSTQVILMTAFASTDTAIAAMKEGAADYITKPFKIDELTVQVAKALDVRQLERENTFLKKQLATSRKSVGLVGTSEAMRRVNEMVARVAPAKTTVLITGESGTGKEMFARSIHAQSDRASRPFIPINCGAIPETLIESELFGHTKGAFTGATGDKKGLFSAAEGGTIFLDEIGELPLSMQVKLLRVLQERKIKRVGSATEETVDARVVAATNRDLRDMVKAGTFREDLFYRLNVIELHLPPLRERRDDIPLLIHHFIAKYAADLGKTIRGVEKEAMQCLLGHSYQGNVRELENIVERAVTLELTELITRDSLPFGMQEAVRATEFGGTLDVPEEGVDLEAIVEQLERTLIAKALRRSGGVRTEAAALLKISFRSLRYRLQKYGIDGGDIDDAS